MSAEQKPMVVLNETLVPQLPATLAEALPCRIRTFVRHAGVAVDEGEQEGVTCQEPKRTDRVRVRILTGRHADECVYYPVDKVRVFLEDVARFITGDSPQLDATS